MTNKTNTKQGARSRALHTLNTRTQPLVAFWNKFNNDWSWNNAAGLAYNLQMSMFPLVIAFIAIIGLFLSRLDPTAFDNLTRQITNIFPATTSSQSIIKPALQQVAHDSGLLGVLAIVLAVFNGSRLFLFLEGTLDIIYHVRPRNPLAQNIMSIGMLLLFVVLLPLMVVASSMPALVLSLLQQTPLSRIPGSSLLFSLGGILGGLIVGYILFQAIYMIVPNQKISFRNSWLGAVVAAMLLEIYLILFPLFVAHFLGSFAGALGLLILLVFFYYFAMILYIGAEVNAFFAEGIGDISQDLATMVYHVTHDVPSSEQKVNEPTTVAQKQEGRQIDSSKK